MTEPKVGLMFAESGQYEEFRARPIAAYESFEDAEIEAVRRNNLVFAAREKLDALSDLENSEKDGDWELAEKRRTRITDSLRRETTDPLIDSHEIRDLSYTVIELRFVR